MTPRPRIALARLTRTTTNMKDLNTRTRKVVGRARRESSPRCRLQALQTTAICLQPSKPKNNNSNGNN